MCHVCYACINNEGAVIKQKAFKLLLCLPVIFVLALSAYSSTHPKTVHAADSNVADGITVDSTLDTADANIGDGICDDGSGNCTLRAAIEEANSDPDASTIEFNISGTPDFTNNSQDGYTISPASALPQITEQVTIDGYSQPGAQANTAVAPNPLNGTLLIEIDGSYPGAGDALRFEGDAAGSRLSGFVVGDRDGNGVEISSDNIEIKGNYIGTDPTGTVAHPNFRGVSGWEGSGDYAQIGGLNPEDRNLISGNGTAGIGDGSGSGIGMGPGHDHWTFQGNYIGIAADGVTALPNATVGGSGSPSVDFVEGTVIGGGTVAATNVISGNNGHGIAPYLAPNTRIEGNIIGLDYTGTQPLGNTGGSIHIGSSDNTSIIGNTVADNGGGLYIHESHNVTIQGNLIGTNASGTSAFPNGQYGVLFDNSDDAVIGGTNPGERNIISANATGGISIADSNNAAVLGNYIGTAADGVSPLGNSGDGISIQGTSVNAVIGGTNPGERNIIAFNDGYGISSTGDPAYDTLFSVLGNSVYSNAYRGIALSFNAPATLIDPLDSDTGANNLLNFPEDLEYEEDGSNTNITYSLDVPAGDYRIEFFSNTTADPSGYGEGETFLGAQNVTSLGSGSQSFTYTLSGTGHANISSTATLIDGDTPSGFGETSEFSRIATPPPPISDIQTIIELTNPQDMAIGATANYTVAYTNNGPDNADLSGFQNVGAGPGLFYVYVQQSDLINPSGQVADGPFPGSKIIDSGNPDLSCIYVPAPMPVSFGLTSDDTVAVLSCWFIGSDTALEPGSSITADFSFEVAPDSDLEFISYASGNPPVADPDKDSYEQGLLSGDLLAYMINNPMNNFSSASYPVPIDPEPPTTNTNGSGSQLAATGVNAALITAIASLMVLGAGVTMSRFVRAK